VPAIKRKNPKAICKGMKRDRIDLHELVGGWGSYVDPICAERAKRLAGSGGYQSPSKLGQESRAVAAKSLAHLGEVQYAVNVSSWHKA